MNLFFNKNSIRPNFWTLQILGFLLFCFNEIGRNWSSYFESFTSLSRLLFNNIILFLLTLGLRYFYRYIYAKNKRLISYLVNIVIASSFFGFLWEELGIISNCYIFGLNDNWISIERGQQYLSYILMDMWPLFVWSILYFGIKFWYDMIIERERSKASIHMATEAELKMLRFQINPHLLFNSLNSVQALMYKDVKKADQMLTELSEFLRYTLKYNNEIYITLLEEIEIISKYLFVEKIRFNERLDYTIEIPESIQHEKILCFITQPFIENAIKHGMKSNPYGKMNIKVLAKQENNWLVIQIFNTGRWKNNNIEYGLGIRNVKERLDNAYKNRHDLSIYQINDEIMVELKIRFDE